MTSPRRPDLLSVTELTRTVREVLEGVVGEVWVEGEIANYRKQASGHQYFTLKDEKCQLPCVLFFRPGLRHATIPLENGMLVHARGNLTVYEARGAYQLNIAQVSAAGAGALAAKFEALKARLAGEGLFDPARKRPLPRFPAVIGIVTSATGAVIADMLNILERRAPWVRVVLHPARVQGAGAARELAGALEWFNTPEAPKVDLVVLARGGGSAEDLWEFNEEILARAIAASALPVVSAVGHEIDFSISDFVADLRAPTPSAAAELIVPDGGELRRRLAQCGSVLERHVRHAMETARTRLLHLSGERLAREPRTRLNAWNQQLDYATEALHRAAREQTTERGQRLAAALARLKDHRPQEALALAAQRVKTTEARLHRSLEARYTQQSERFERAANLLRVLGPGATLRRGYSITRLPDGTILRSVDDAPEGTLLQTGLADGLLESRVHSGKKADWESRGS